MNITSEAEDIQDGSGTNNYSGEVSISLPENSTTPTAYSDIIYNKTSFSDSNFQLNTSTGIITVLKNMKGMVIYNTTARVNNNSYTNFFHKLLIDTGSGFTDVANSTYSGNTNRASFAKGTSTGVVIMNLNVNDKLKVAVSACHLTNTGGNDIVYITKDTSISIVDLFGGEQGPIGPSGEIPTDISCASLLVNGVSITKNGDYNDSRLDILDISMNQVILNIENITGGAQEHLDTLAELGAALDNSANLASNMTSQFTVVNNSISTNTGNISTNTGNINTNTGNISTNTGNISTNTGNISTNTGNISTNTTKLSGIAEGAEVNVQSDWNASSGDALILNKPTIPSGNQIIDWTQDQGATNIDTNNYVNTTYSVSDGGLTQNNFTDALKTKLDGISSSANNYSLSTASSTVLGGIKVGTNLSIDGNGVLSASGGGTTINTINDISDVDITGVQEGDVLKWNNTLSKFESKNLATTSSSSQEGQVLEVITGICDGRDVIGKSGTYTMPNVTAGQSFTSTYEDLTGSEISYKPPIGTRYIKYSFRFHLADDDDYNWANAGLTLYIDNVAQGSPEMVGNSYYGDEYVLVSWIIGITGTTSASDITFDNWTDNKTIKLKVKERDHIRESRAHLAGGYSTSIGSDTILIPQIEIIAIGESHGQTVTISQSSISDLSDVSFNTLTNGDLLIWDSTNNYFKAEAPQNAGKWSGSGDIYYNGGDVGIGVTPTGYKLDVGGSLRLRTDGDCLLRMEADTDNTNEEDNPLIWMSNDNNADYNFKMGMVGTAGQIFTDSLQNGGFISSYKTIQLATGTSPATRLTVLQDGNVGIGTPTPTAALSVVGGRVDSSHTVGCHLGQGDNYAFLELCDSIGGHIDFASGNGDEDADGRIIYTHSEHKMSFATNGTSAHMTIDEDGYVGIGTTTPTAALSVVGGRKDGSHPVGCHLGQASSRAFLELCHGTGAQIDFATGDGSNDYGGRIDYRHDNNKMSFGTNGTGGHMTIDSAGNVGIGTDSPGAKLEINGTTTTHTNTTPTNPSCLIYGSHAGETLWIGHPNQTQGIQLGYNTIKKWGKDDVPSDALFFNISGINDMTIKADTGNVGIGTTSPTSALTIKRQISGTATAQGTGAQMIDFKSYLAIEGHASSPFDPETVKSSIYSGVAGAPNTNTRSGFMAFMTADEGTLYERLRINYDGNVGIGTTSPDKTLHLHNSSRVDIKFDTGDEDHYIRKDGDYLRFRGHDDSTILFELQNNNSVTNNSKPSNNICCFPSGNVGIGETSPGAPLHLSYTNGAYNNVQGFINEATSGRSTTRLRSTTNEATELFFDVNNAIRWDFSCRSSANNYDLYIYKAGTNPTLTSLGSGAYPVMVLTQTGRVGIGTSSPSAKLHVNGSTTGTSGSGYYIAGNSSTLTLDTNWSNDNLSIYASHSIFAAVFSGASDERIKENITEIDDSYSLQKVRDISCVWYNYKDKVSRGDVRVAGFIAQQVKEHLPEAVSVTQDFLPNEMRNLEDISWNGTDMSCDLGDVSGVKYRFYVSNDLSGNEEEMKEIVGNRDNSFTFDVSYNNIFCYGKEIDNFHILDKQKLFALNFSATQELDRKVITLEEENKTLKERLEALEKRLSDAGI